MVTVGKTFLPLDIATTLLIIVIIMIIVPFENFRVTSASTRQLLSDLG